MVASEELQGAERQFYASISTVVFQVYYCPGKGVHRQRSHLGDAGKGVPNVIGEYHDGLIDYFSCLANRLRRVRICCGDWSRVCGPTPTIKRGLTGVFLDPPYSKEVRDAGCYSTDTDCASAAREWCLANGDNPLLRTALCGYNNEGHDEPLVAAGWEAVPWKAHGGYASQGHGRGRENASREVIWFSPHCLSGNERPVPTTASLFAEGDGKNGA